MNARSRGRPLKPSGWKRLQLLQPPDHIKSRIFSRAGKTNQHWIDVLQNMDEYQKLITAYRRKFRIKEIDALNIVASFNEDVPQNVLDEALLNVKGWKKFSEAGLRGRGYQPPKWHEVLISMKENQHAGYSDRQTAQIVQLHEQKANRPVPHERSVRRFLSKLKNSGAYL